MQMVLGAGTSKKMIFIAEASLSLGGGLAVTCACGVGNTEHKLFETKKISCIFGKRFQGLRVLES